MDTNSIADHYLHGDLLGAIRDSITKMGKSPDNITVEDLGPVDEFHIGGRLATEQFLSQLKFSEQDHVLDVGCGLGGASRFVASTYKARVSGVDLTQEYIDTGNALSKWVNLDHRIKLQMGNVLNLSFADASFDGAYMLHVGMNIADKYSLFREIHRVLKPGAYFGIYDIMRIEDGALAFPVPWAGSGETSFLGAPDQYRHDLLAAGFEAGNENNRRDFSLDFFRQMKARTEANGGPPPLGLHTLMKDSTPVKIKNMIDNIAADLIAPVEMIARKQI